ncbi:sugar ABC transporter substrate-binding protein [Spirochaetia bacterium]|nr:sugar ABC transporter substrate-binding protein [Spirochaetia bacterium]
MMKKFLVTAAIALVSVSTVFAAGGNQAAGSGNAVKITATYWHFGGIVSETIVGKAWEELMEKKLGVDLDITWNFIPQGEYNEKLNIILATNDLTDLTFIPNKGIAAPYEGQGIFEDISKHWDKLPNFAAYLKNVKYGLESISNADGTIYGFFNGGLIEGRKGVAISTPMAIRYDTFQQLGIKPPETTVELLDAARKLKAAFPDKYPVAGGVNSLAYTYKTSGGIYWDGAKYVYGPITDNYKNMLLYLNRLYTEKLLDPESFTDNTDARTRKAINDSTYIFLSSWFNAINDYNLNENFKGIWANILNVDDPATGPGWKPIGNSNEPTIAYNGEGTYIKAGAKNMDILLKLCDLQYDPETIRLISWGIEGLTYTLKSDGSPTFVEKFHQSDNFWAVGDEYGIRASTKFRPGLQGPTDLMAYLDCAPLEYAFIDGKLVQVSWEVAFPNEPWPTSPWIPPNAFELPIQFTPDENNANSVITTAVGTYVEESRMKFITGELNFNQWDAYVAQVKRMNIQQVLDMRDRKAAAFK